MPNWRRQIVYQFGVVDLDVIGDDGKVINVSNGGARWRGCFKMIAKQVFLLTTTLEVVQGKS